MLDELLAKLNGLPEKDRQAVIDMAVSTTADMKWVPNPGPQTEAYFSEADEVYYGGQAGGGKDLALDTPIPTPSGWSTMGDLRPGDFVFDESGNPCRVVAKSEIFNKPAYKISFHDGEEIVAGPGHQWVTSSELERSRKSRKGLPFSSIRTTKEVMDTLRSRSGSLNHSISACGALNIPEQELPIDPYLLGVWLGDVVSSGARVTIAEDEMVSAVGNSLHCGWHITKGSTKYDYGTVGGLRVALRSLGLLGNKHIPVIYQRSSFEQRLALLQGLMDSDGYCDSRGQCEFTQIRFNLACDFQELLCGLGIKASISHGVAKLNGRVIGPNYRIKFLTEHPAFRLPRKLIRQKRAGFIGTHELRFITSVDCVGVVPTQCIQVDSPSRMYLCGRTFVPTHNSDLILGLAANEHAKSLILRKYFSDAQDLGERFIDIVGTRDGWNGQFLRYRGDVSVDFGGCQHEKDKQRYKGRPHDLIAFDEIPDFPYSVFSFIKAWNRSATGRRCRVVCAGNPPTEPEGLWVIQYWAPWLDPEHPNPAKSGEIRWFVTGGDDLSVEVEGPGEYEIDGEVLPARSRTFIRSTLSDNPDLADTDYDAVLASMPAELRAAYRDGQFQNTLKDQPKQIIPAAWVKAAQDRWTDQPPAGVPMCAIGVDVAQGGNDNNIIAPRYDGWYDKLTSIPGADTPLGTDLLGPILTVRRHNAVVVLDVGGGYGGTTYAKLKENNIPVHAHKGAVGSHERSRDGIFYFANKRTEVYWRFREALDPDQPGGSRICLPKGAQLFVDLTSPTYKTKGSAGKLIIQAEPKEDLVKRLGRSPDEGDAVVNAWSAGDKIENSYDMWENNKVNQKLGRRPQVIMKPGGRRRN